jgi:hypothetical protein
MTNKFKIENTTIPLPDDYPLRVPSILDHMDDVRATLQAIKTVVINNPTYRHAKEPLLLAMRDLALAEGRMLEAVHPQKIVTVDHEADHDTNPTVTHR